MQQNVITSELPHFTMHSDTFKAIDGMAFVTLTAEEVNSAKYLISDFRNNDLVL